jgi:hypothetical protein
MPKPQKHFFGAKAVDQPAAQGGRDSGEDAQDGDKVAARARGDGQGVLGELRHEDHAHHHYPHGEPQDERDEGSPGGEIGKVQHGIGAPALDQDQEGQKDEEADKEGVDVCAAERGGKVEEVHVAESVKKEKDHSRKNGDARPVNLRPGFALVVRQEKEAGHDDGQGDGNVDQEKQVPARCPEDAEDSAAYGRAEDVGDPINAADEAQSHAAFFRGEGCPEFGGGDRHDPSSAQGLDHAPRQENPELPGQDGQGADEGSQAEEPDADKVDHFSPKTVGKLSGYRDDGRVGEGVDSDHPYPRPFVDTQGRLYQGARGRHDASVDGSHEYPEEIEDEHDREILGLSREGIP